MNIYQRFTMDEARTDNGVWYDIDRSRVVPSDEVAEWLEDPDNSGILVARLGTGNKELLKALANRKPSERLDMNNVQLVAEGCVRTWRGPAWVNAAGEPVEYSLEACVKVMRDLPELLGHVLVVAQEAAYYRAQVLDEQAKNS